MQTLNNRLFYRYNPNTNVWSSEVASLSGPRSGVCVVEMDGLMYALGGFDGMTCTNIVERYYTDTTCRRMSGLICCKDTVHIVVH